MNIRSRKLILSGTLAVSVLGAGTFAYGSLGGSGTASSQSATRLVTANVGSVQSSISTSGTLEPATSLDLNFQNAGTLTKVTVEVGDTVTAGQVLAKIDDTSAKVDLEKAKANLLAAKDKLAAAEAGTTTSESSTTDDTTPNGTAAPADNAQPSGSSASTTSTTTTTTTTTTTVDPVAVAQATAGVHEAQLAVDDAQKALDATTLKAPMSGTITALNYTVGQKVNGGTTTSSSGATPFATLVDAAKMVVSVSWAEADAGKIAVGQHATVEIDSLSRTVNGSVTSIATTSTVTNNVVTYEGVVTLDEVPDGIKSGMSATVKVVTASKDGVITIPSAAVTTKSGTSTVTVSANGQTSTRTVTLGLKGDGSTEVVSGLSAGEQVVMSVGTVSATASSSGTSGGASSTGLGSTLGGGFSGGPPSGR